MLQWCSRWMFNSWISIEFSSYWELALDASTSRSCSMVNILSKAVRAQLIIRFIGIIELTFHFHILLASETDDYGPWAYGEKKTGPVGTAEFFTLPLYSRYAYLPVSRYNNMEPGALRTFLHSNGVVSKTCYLAGTLPFSTETFIGLGGWGQ